MSAVHARSTVEQPWRRVDVRPLAIEFPSWPLTLLSVPILVRAALFAVVLVVEPWSASPTRIIPAWAQVLQACCFASLAFILLRYGRSDRRAWSLGLFVLDVASTLLSPFARDIAAPSAVTVFALSLRTDAFQAALVWFFAGLFPRSSTRPAVAQLYYLGTALAFTLGLVLVVFDAAAVSGSLDSSSTVGGLAQLLRRDALGDGDWYFTLQFLSLVPLLFLMPSKLGESGPDDRRRFLWLTLGILGGFLPLVLNVLLSTIWPAYATNGPSRQVKGVIIVVSLTAVPLAGAYAALIQRTLDVRLVIRRAFQYVLARSFVRGLSVAPLLGLVALVSANRDQSVVSLVSGPSGLALAGLAGAVFASAAMSGRLLTALDRRFFRQEAHTKAVLTDAADNVRRMASVHEVRELAAAAIDQAFHPETSLCLVIGADENLHAIDADLPPLLSASALAQFVGTSDAPLDLSTAAVSLVARLDARDRGWLRSSGATLLIPLRGAAGQLLGLMAIGEKQSELPYAKEDQELLAALGSSAGLALERVLSLESQSTRRRRAVLADPPARECVDCGTVFSAATPECPCGGVLQRSSAPHILEDRLRFEQRIGAGAMGVVYRAIDLRVAHARAVKTLSAADPAMMARLRREARSMAAAHHQNLATLHGVEIWRGVPMLVMEFLEGGTLSERLRRGPLAVADTLAMGMQLCNGLDAIHRIGLLHRDVKPSNIGFSADAVPKLLDFGLAKLVAPSEASTTGAAAHAEPEVASVASSAGPVRGTPAYLSPEVLAGAHPTAGDDLWSLAVTLLEACAGANPFQGSTVADTLARVSIDSPRTAEAASSLPPAVRRLFTELLGPKAGRPSTASQFAHRLTQLT